MVLNSNDQLDVDDGIGGVSTIVGLSDVHYLDITSQIFWFDSG